VGRRQILAVHTRSVPLAEDADLDAVARSTPGMVGADLANLVNEAALLAARRGHTTVAQHDLLDALEQVVLGAERRLVLSAADRRRTAYHEAAHALIGMLLPDADPVRKVSIIPRRCSSPTGPSSTGWPRRCWSTRRSTRSRRGPCSPAPRGRSPADRGRSCWARVARARADRATAR